MKRFGILWLLSFQTNLLGDWGLVSVFAGLRDILFLGVEGGADIASTAVLASSRDLVGGCGQASLSVAHGHVCVAKLRRLATRLGNITLLQLIEVLEDCRERASAGDSERNQDCLHVEVEDEVISTKRSP